MQSGTAEAEDPTKPRHDQDGTAESRLSGFASYWPESVTLAAFMALLAWAIPFHEPWADEAQAWQIARSVSFTSLFKTYLRYEGTPGLWHLLEWVLVRLHVSYAGLHWVCGAIAAAACALLLFSSPFPRYLKLPLPFTYFLAFQYAIIARNYVLAPLLLFLIAWFWKRRPLAVALLLGLLANTSLHLAVISAGLAIVFLLERLRAGLLRTSAQRTELAISSLGLVGFYALAVYTAKPPHDIAFQTHSGSMAMQALFRIVALLQPYVLALLFWIAMALCFAARCALVYLLPVALCAAFCVAEYSNWWHVGLLWPLIITLLWITWPRTVNALPRPTLSRRELAGRVALSAFTAVQIAWSVYAFQFDHRRAYSPDRAAATYLRPFVERGDTIAVTYADAQSTNAFNAVGILPYFDRNIYLNFRRPFWWWSTQDTTEADFDRLLSAHSGLAGPRLVIVEAVFKGSMDTVALNEPRYASLAAAGYRYSTAFCGSIPERLSPSLTNCHVIFTYAGDASGAGSPTPVLAMRP